MRFLCRGFGSKFEADSANAKGLKRLAFELGPKQSRVIDGMTLGDGVKLEILVVAALSLSASTTSLPRK